MCQQWHSKLIAIHKNAVWRVIIAEDVSVASTLDRRRRWQAPKIIIIKFSFFLCALSHNSLVPSFPRFLAIERYSVMQRPRFASMRLEKLPEQLFKSHVNSSNCRLSVIFVSSAVGFGHNKVYVFVCLRRAFNAFNEMNECEKWI